MRDFHIGDRVRYVPKPSGRITPISDIQYKDLMAHPYGTVRAFFFKNMLRLNLTRLVRDILAADGYQVAKVFMYIHKSWIAHQTRK